MKTYSTPMWERTDEILEAARHLFGQRGSTWEQFRRYTIEHLAWCEAEGLRPPVDAAARRRYRAHLQAAGKLASEHSWNVRATVLNKLPEAAAELGRREQVEAKKQRTRLIDALPAGSALRQAIEELCDGKPASYRASLRADLAVVLEWCLGQNLNATALGPAELGTFELWLAHSGRRSRGPLFASRWLHRRFWAPIAWWRNSE